MPVALPLPQLSSWRCRPACDKTSATSQLPHLLPRMCSSSSRAPRPRVAAAPANSSEWPGCLSAGPAGPSLPSTARAPPPTAVVRGTAAADMGPFTSPRFSGTEGFCTKGDASLAGAAAQNQQGCLAAAEAGDNQQGGGPLPLQEREYKSIQAYRILVSSQGGLAADAISSLGLLNDPKAPSVLVQCSDYPPVGVLLHQV